MFTWKGAYFLSNSFSPEEKIQIVLEYKSGKGSQGLIAKKYGTNWTAIQRWTRLYDTFGEDAFYKDRNRHYSIELKQDAVNAYLAGEGSYESICKKYKIQSSTQLKRWVMMYTDSGRLKASGTGGTILKEGRSTTFEERIEIAAYCIEHNHNYSETAEKYSVSYQQARSYTVKYEANGIDALQDRRGKRKPDDALTEIERLKAELKLEKAKRLKAEMEASFLKKLEEIERRRG